MLDLCKTINTACYYFQIKRKLMGCYSAFMYLKNRKAIKKSRCADRVESGLPSVARSPNTSKEFCVYHKGHGERIMTWVTFIKSFGLLSFFSLHGQ